MYLFRSGFRVWGLGTILSGAWVQKRTAGKQRQVWALNLKPEALNLEEVDVLQDVSRGSGA